MKQRLLILGLLLLGGALSPAHGAYDGPVGDYAAPAIGGAASGNLDMAGYGVWDSTGPLCVGGDGTNCGTSYAASTGDVSLGASGNIVEVRGDFYAVTSLHAAIAAYLPVIYYHATSAFGVMGKAISSNYGWRTVTNKGDFHWIPTLNQVTGFTTGFMNQGSRAPRLWLWGMGDVRYITDEYTNWTHNDFETEFNSGTGGYSFRVPAQKAKGTLTLTGLPTATETFVINNTTMTAVAASPDPNEFLIGADIAETCDNIVAAMLLSSEAANVAAWTNQEDQNIVKFGFETEGASGNSIIFTEALTNATANGSGTLGGSNVGVAAATVFSVTEEGDATFATGDLAITLGDANILAGSLYLPAGNLEIQTGTATVESHLTVSTGDANILAGNLFLPAGSITLDAGDVTIGDDLFVTDDANITTGDLYLVAGNLEVQAGTATIEGNTTVTSGNLTVSGGTATVQSHLTVTAGDVNVLAGSFYMPAGSAVLSAGDLTLTSGDVTLTAGALAVDGNVTIDSGNLSMENIATSPGLIADHGQVYVKTDKLLYYLDSDGLEYLVAGASNPVFKSYSHTTGPTGSHYMAGFYETQAADIDLNQGALTATFGTANSTYAAHAFFVSAGNATVDANTVSLRVTGTSITDAGVRDPNGVEVLLADITASSGVDTYIETSLKFIGQITYELVNDGATTFDIPGNVGLAKYDDYGNRALVLVDTECVGQAGANDASFDLEIIHHRNTGWTYSAAAFVAGPAATYQMTTDHVTETELVNGERFAWKRAGLNDDIDGSASEGLIIRVTTGAANSVDQLDCHLGVTY